MGAILLFIGTNCKEERKEESARATSKSVYIIMLGIPLWVVKRHRRTLKRGKS